MPKDKVDHTINGQGTTVSTLGHHTNGTWWCESRTTNCTILSTCIVYLFLHVHFELLLTLVDRPTHVSVPQVLHNMQIIYNMVKRNYNSLSDDMILF